MGRFDPHFVRILFLILTFLLLGLPSRAQIPDSGNGETTGMPAGEPPTAYPVAEPAPAAAQDAEAAREKLLKAADQIDMIQSNSETTKAEVDGMKNDIAQLQASNDALKQQVAQLQTALDKAEAERVKERQVLLDQVAGLIAQKSAAAHHHHVEDVAEDSGSSQDTPPASAADATGPDRAADGGDLAPPPEPISRPQKGYYHLVESGETLTMICAAYREQGIKVSLAQVKKANGLGDKSVLHVGQKLFIPQPGT